MADNVKLNKDQMPGDTIPDTDITRCLRVGSAALAWFEASGASHDVWSMDACQDAWQRFIDVLAEERRHVRH
jgi:hypothetical protein